MAALCLIWRKTQEHHLGEDNCSSSLKQQHADSKPTYCETANTFILDDYKLPTRNLMHPIPDDKYPPYLQEPRGYKWGPTSYPKEPVVEKSLSLLQLLQFFIDINHLYFRFLVPLIYGLKKNKHELRKQGKRVNEPTSVALTTCKYCSQLLFL